jgi:hypothetical protein
MPKLKATADEVFVLEVKKSMLDAGVPTVKRLGELLLVSEPTIRRRFKNPDTWTRVEIRRLDKVVRLSDVAINAFLGRIR